MTIQEFSNSFDVLLSSYLSKPEFGNTDSLALDEYEKSVFLTKAQEDIVVELYSGRNIQGLSFESTEESRRILHSLTKEYQVEVNNTDYEVTKPNDLWFITYEYCIFDDETLGCANGSTALVVPIRQDDLYKVLDNPFRGPSKKRVIRTDRNNSIQLISKYKIGTYTMDYLRKPNPIILAVFPDLSIGDIINETSECELNSSIHHYILERAVQYALTSKGLLNNKE